MGDYGFKISKPGIDVKSVLSSSDQSQLVMSSSWNMLKTAATGTFVGSGTLAHGLPYAPIFLNFSQGATLNRMRLSSIGGMDSTNLTFEGTTLQRYYIFYQQAI